MANVNTRTRPPADVDLPIVAAFTCRDLLDEIAYDDDIPVYRRNEARQAVVDFDGALKDESP